MNFWKRDKAFTIKTPPLSNGKRKSQIIPSYSPKKWLQETKIPSYWQNLSNYISKLDRYLSFHLSSLLKRSPVLVEFRNFTSRLLKEQDSMKNMLEMGLDEIKRMETVREKRRKEMFLARPPSPDGDIQIDPSLVHSSPTVMLRILQKSIQDKMIAIDRELFHYIRTNILDHLELKYRHEIPLYESKALSHPESDRKNAWQQADQFFNAQVDPGHLIAFALDSWEVRELMSILEEAKEILSFIYSFTSEPSFENYHAWFEKRRYQLEQVIHLGQYNTSIQTHSPDGLATFEAKLVNFHHIEFRYSRQSSAQSFFSSIPFRPSSRMTTTSTTSANSSASSSSIDFSVTIHYALNFHILRSMLNIPSFSKSIYPTVTWNPSGGKSSSLFWKTINNEIVLKTIGGRRWRLLKWGKGMPERCADEDSSTTDDELESWTEVLVPSEEEKNMILNFVPLYLSYMLRDVGGIDGALFATGDFIKKPTLLSKIFGTYRVKLYRNDIESGSQIKLDTNILIMEQIFSGHHISKQFDLKGIPSRQISVTKDNENVTLWDKNWIDLSTHPNSLIYVDANSKKLFKEALDNDLQFLMSANIVDYSLLVGIDESKKNLVVGIVDYVGSYNFWKKLENASKSTLKYMESKVKIVAQIAGLEKQEDQLFENSFTKLIDTERKTGFFKRKVQTPSSPPKSPSRERKTVSSGTLNVQVTIQPPSLYASRFQDAMEDYFRIDESKENH